MSGVIGHNGAEQSHRQSHAADDGVFPGRFKRSDFAVEGDEEDGSEGGGFDGYPHHSQVVGHRHEQHGENKQGRERVVHAKLVELLVAGSVVAERTAILVVAQVADGVGGAYQRDGSGKKDHKRTQRIGEKETIPKGDRARCQHSRSQCNRYQKDGD